MSQKVGQILYSVSVDEDTGKVSFEEYVVRTIRGGFIHAIWKNSLTWGKRSNKHGDYGWLKNIPSWCREKWNVDPSKGPRRRYDIHTTKLAAIRSAIKHHRAGDFESGGVFATSLKTLKAMETRHKPKRGTAKGGDE